MGGTINMAVTYGYFNSLNGDRVYSADQMSEYFDGLVSNGVYESVGGGLQVLAISDMTVGVQTGRALVNCKWLKNDAVLSVDITAAHAVLNRYSAVVLRLDNTNRLVEITTKDGTPASTPTKPTMQSDSSIVELCLAYVYVAAATTSITQADIEDARGTSVCPWITGLIDQVDTSTLFLQYQAAWQQYYDTMTQAFNNWFETLTDELNVNTFIDKYQKTVTMGAGSSAIIPLDMQGYTYAATDVFNVFINGLLANPGVDYTINDNQTITVFATAVGTVIQIQALKSRIGFDLLVTNNNEAIVTDSNAGIEG